MLLTVCMIAKNEEALLPEFLEHHSKLTRHFVVVDTGSTDQTREIATAAGARTADFAWGNDFSAARNFSLTLATTPWILVLDPDERIAERDFTSLITSIETAPTDVQAFAITSRNYVVDSRMDGFVRCRGEYPHEEKSLPGYCKNTKVVLFRNHSQIQFDGLVHETVLKSLTSPLRALDFPMHHYGQLPHLVTQKSKQVLYRDIVQKKAEQNPQDAQAQFELGMTSLELKDYQTAQKAFERALSLKPQHPLILSKLATTYRRLNRFEDSKNLCHILLKADAAHPEALMTLGMIAMEESQWTQAAERFALHLATNPDSIVAARNLAECYRHLRQKSEALHVLDTMLTRFPDHPDLRADRLEIERQALS